MNLLKGSLEDISEEKKQRIGKFIPTFRWDILVGGYLVSPTIFIRFSITQTGIFNFNTHSSLFVSFSMDIKQWELRTYYYSVSRRTCMYAWRCAGRLLGLKCVWRKIL